MPTKWMALGLNCDCYKTAIYFTKESWGRKIERMITVSIWDSCFPGYCVLLIGLKICVVLSINPKRHLPSNGTKTT